MNKSFVLMGAMGIKEMARKRIEYETSEKKKNLEQKISEYSFTEDQISLANAEEILPIEFIALCLDLATVSAEEMNTKMTKYYLNQVGNIRGAIERGNLSLASDLALELLENMNW